jgi:hypothetical protein
MTDGGSAKAPIKFLWAMRSRESSQRRHHSESADIKQHFHNIKPRRLNQAARADATTRGRYHCRITRACGDYNVITFFGAASFIG